MMDKSVYVAESCASSADETVESSAVGDAVLVGGIPDHLNRNLAIRDSVAEALAARLGERRVHVASLYQAEKQLRHLDSGFVLVFGSVLADESDFTALAHAARQRGFRVVFWLTDDPYEFDACYKFTDFADLVFTNDRWTRSYYRRTGVFHLPTGASKERYYRTIQRNDAAYKIDVFFCGVGFSNRQAIIDGLGPVLARYDTVICGAEWNENASYIRNRRLTPEELVSYYHRSRIVLNLARDHSYANDRFKITPSTPGPRTFEAAMVGAFQMIFADRPEVMDYYTLDREIVMFSSLSDFDKKVRYYLANSPDRIRIARAAQARTIRDHQYINRVDELLRRLAESAVASTS